MITYRIYVLDMEVYEWTDKGQGEYVFTKGGYEAGSYLTPEELREGLEEQFPGIELVQGLLHYVQVENGEGYRDDNGEYIVEYTIAVEKLQIEPFFLDSEREEAA